MKAVPFGTAFFCAIANYFLNNSYICSTNYHWGQKLLYSDEKDY